VGFQRNQWNTGIPVNTPAGMQENIEFLQGPKNKFLQKKILQEMLEFKGILRIPVFYCIFFQNKTCQKRKLQPSVVIYDDNTTAITASNPPILESN
jgi:hypothetical protein